MGQVPLNTRQELQNTVSWIPIKFCTRAAEYCVLDSRQILHKSCRTLFPGSHDAAITAGSRQDNLLQTGSHAHAECPISHPLTDYILQELCTTTATHWCYMHCRKAFPDTPSPAHAAHCRPLVLHALQEGLPSHPHQSSTRCSLPPTGATRAARRTSRARSPP